MHLLKVPIKQLSDVLMQLHSLRMGIILWMLSNPWSIIFRFVTQQLSPKAYKSICEGSCGFQLCLCYDVSANEFSLSLG